MVVGCQPLTGEPIRWIKDTVSGLSNPHDAAARNRVSKMQRYVQQGGDVNKPNKLGDTPLHEACAYIRDNGDSSKGRKRKGVGRDRRKVGKKHSQRALGSGGPLEMLELLLSAGSNINAQNIVGDAPLHKAALNGRSLSTDYLIRSGANVNIRNEFAQTPLHAACVSGNIEVVQRLVQGGADTSAQDAAEDTPFHEACRHQYEGIVIYLMGLVNNPETNQGLKLWRGLDPSWEKMLRSRAQPPPDVPEKPAQSPATVHVATTRPSSAGLGLSTPSTTHNSMQSSGSAKGSAMRTPQGGGDFGGGKHPGRVAVSVQSWHTESMSPPNGPRARGGGGGGHARQRSSGTEAICATTRAKEGPPGKTSNGSGGSRASAQPKRGRDVDRVDTEGTIPRTFSTGAAEVLNWQATKVKSAQQGRLIEKAREALREEQDEAAMAMSHTTMVDDDASVDTLNTADTLTTADSRKAEAKVRSHRNDSLAGSECGGALTPPLSRRGSGAVSPVTPTPSTAGHQDAEIHAPLREGRRRGSVRKSKTVMALRSPQPRLIRRPPSSARSSAGADSAFFGNGGGGDGGDGGSNGRRPAHRGGGNGDRPPSGLPDGRDSRPSSRSRGTRSRPSPSGSGGDEYSPAQQDVTVSLDSSGKGQQRRPRQQDGAGDGGEMARSPSSRREKHRQRAGNEGGSSPRRGGRRVHREASHHQQGQGSEEDGGAKASSSRGSKEHHGVGGGRRRDSSNKPSRGDGAAPDVREAEAHVDEAVKGPHQMRTPRQRDSISAHLAANGPGSKGQGGQAAWERPREPSNGSASSGRPSAFAPKRRTAGSGSGELRPPSWASDVSAGLEEALPRRSKKIIESEFPVRRVSPYKTRSSSKPAVAQLVPESPRRFFCASPAVSSVASTNGKGGRVSALLEADESNSCCGSPLPDGNAAVVPTGKDSRDRPVALTAAEASVATVFVTAPFAATAREGGIATMPTPVAERGVDPVTPVSHRGSGKCSVTSTEDDVPPHIDALRMSDHSDGCVLACAAEAVIAEAAKVEAPVVVEAQVTEASTPHKVKSWAISRERRASSDAAMTMANSDVLLFSDSDSDSGNDRLSAEVALTGAPAPPPKSDSTAAAFIPSAPRKAGAQAAAPAGATTASNGDAEMAADESAGVMASVVVPLVRSNGGSSGRGGTYSKAPEAGGAPAPLRPPPKRAVSKVDGQASHTSAPSSFPPAAGVVPVIAESSSPPAGNPVGGSPDASEDVADSAPVAAKVAAENGVGTVEPSAAPRPASQSSTPESKTAGRASWPGVSASPGGIGSRPRSALGRRGSAVPAKTAMPIAGGRVAWNKFLATAAPDVAEDLGDPPAASSAIGRDENGDGGESTGGSNRAAEGEEGESNAAAPVPAASARGPRGFKNPVGLDGPNKGPAGAFAGNAMWRLAGGAGSSASRAHSGVAANGHGGYSNPLAAMRGNGGAAPGPDGAPAVGVLGATNPLLGLRGVSAAAAAGGGDGGLADPLARRRGPRFGGGVTANPMLGGGNVGRKTEGINGVVNPYLRGVNGGRGLPAGGRTTAAVAAPPPPPPSAVGDNRGGGSGRGCGEGAAALTAPPAASVASLALDLGRSKAAANGGRRGGAVEFKAIGSDGGWHKSEILPPASVQTRALQQIEAENHADRDPGQALVASVVMALQKQSDPRFGVVLREPQSAEVSNVAEQGLVQLRRVKYSPQPASEDGDSNSM